MVHMYICSWKKYVLCGLGVEEVCAMWLECGRSMRYVAWKENPKNSSWKKYVLCGLSHPFMQLLVEEVCAMWLGKPHST